MSKSVFITGAATGIGCTAAHKLDQLGWNVFAGVMPGQDTSDLLADFANITPLEIDITNDALVQQAADLVSEHVGDTGLAALVNNAGVAQVGSGVLEGVPLEDAQLCFDINVFGTLRVTQAFLPLLRRYGPARIVNMSSGAARIPVPTAGIYNMSKMAVNGLTNTLRMELAPFGITAVAIEPGAVQTPMTAGAESNLGAVWETIPEDIRQVYEPVLEEANEYLVEQIDRADKPEYIVENGILHALTMPNPRPRYTVGSEVKMLPLAQRFLPESTFETILRKQYHIEKK